MKVMKKRKEKEMKKKKKMPRRELMTIKIEIVLMPISLLLS